MSAIDLSEFLNRRATALNLSATAISNKAGISRQTWYRLINADVKQARISTLVRVADVLQVNLMELSSLYAQKNTLQRKSLNIINNNDACSFIRDVSYPFNTMVQRGELFEKKWELLNSGNEYWENRTLVCVDDQLNIRLTHCEGAVHAGESAGGLKAQKNRIAMPLTAPGEHVILSAWFYAPKTSGTAISFWKVVNAEGEYCFPDKTGLSCQVRVVEKPAKCFTTKIQA